MQRPTEDSLFVVGEKTPYTHVPNPEADPLSNERIGQKLYLINALQDLAAAKLRDGFAMANPAVAQARYGDRADAVREGAERKKGEFLVSAEENFKRASKFNELKDHIKQFGRYALGKLHPYSVHRTMFSDFAKRFYAGGDSFKARADYRKQLIAEIGDMQGWTGPEEFIPAVTKFNREQGRRPHQEKPTQKAQTTEADKELEKLTTIDKLEAVIGDPRAQFVPKTNHAKNIVASWLDYLDNPKYPAGINNQLFEVYISNQKWLQMTPTEAARSIESIAWEVSDHASDALQSLENIKDLQTKVAECMAPHVTLAEEFPDGHPGLFVWARHRALKELMRTGDVADLDKPMTVLRTTTDPPPSQRPHGTEPGKHKTLQNQFTRPDMLLKFKTYVDELLSRTRIGEVRHEFDEIVEDLTNEFEFFQHRLADIASIDAHTQGNPRFRTAKTVAEQAIAELFRQNTVA